MAKKPTFFGSLGRGIVHNLPLLIGGGVLLLIGVLAEQRILRYLGYSLFIAYVLSCTIQAFYGISAKGYLKAQEEKTEKKEAEKPE